MAGKARIGASKARAARFMAVLPSPAIKSCRGTCQMTLAIRRHGGKPQASSGGRVRSRLCPINCGALGLRSRTGYRVVRRGGKMPPLRASSSMKYQWTWRVRLGIRVRLSRKDFAMTAAWSNITDAIFEHAAARPDAAAVIEGPHTITFRRFAELIGKCAVHLSQLGVKSGDRVGVRMTNSADHLILSLALLRLGAVKFELGAHTSQADLEAVTRKFSLGTLFLEPPMKLYRGARCVPVDLSWREAVDACEGDQRHDDGTGEPWFCNLTSGSTGTPRAVPVTHQQVVERFRSLGESYADTGIFSGETPATYLQFGSLGFAGFHAFMLYQVMAGATAVPVPDFATFYDIVRHVNYFDDVVAMVMPGMCEVFVSCAQKQVMLFPRVRALVSGGGFLRGELKKNMLSRVTPHFYEIYGASGSGWMSVLRPSDMARRAESVGKPTEGWEVEIVDNGGKDVGKNRVGYLRCRSATNSANYLLAEDSAEGGEGFRDGWYYPGDLAQRDGSGYLYLKGRLNDVIRRNGVEIFPAEVEAAMATHDGVRDVAVTGINVRGGQEVVAIVVAKEGASHEDLVAHCKAKLPVEKRPGAIAYTDDLPLTPAGKVDRGRVKAMARQVLERAAQSRKPAGDA
ncbi:MAG: AMP-binding protein [Alphaproteobacteria bacterium]|nr:AMP-binding protein [Alphaproteobacteria bacterium]